MILGFDTGFFLRLLENESEARTVWDRVVEEDAIGAISCLSIYEITKQGLKGAVAKESAEALLEELPAVCRVLWIQGPAQLRHAADIAHGNGLSMADAIILVSLMEAGVEAVYTTDSDLVAYPAGPRIVVL